jgi:hypothetical protein
VCGTYQILVYVYVNLLRKSKGATLDAGKENGLEINAEKNRNMFSLATRMQDKIKYIKIVTSRLLSSTR